MRLDRSAERHRFPNGGALVLLAVWIALAFGTPAPARSEERYRIKGLVDAEFWETDPESRLLSRNEGDPAGSGRLHLMAAGDLFPGLQGFAVGEIEGGKATDEGETEVELEQAFVRYTFGTSRPLMADAGKLVLPFGNFSKRYLSSQNPLIGEPDSYGVSYPIGLSLAGRLARFDYRIAAIDGPLVNENYVPPEIGRVFRPALGVGFTPMIGLRFGSYFTRGPYLGEDVEIALPVGERWRDFEQEVVGLEGEFSRGHFELNADVAWADYEVPTKTEVARGQAWFIEPKYTWSPRLFTALRLERNDYPYIAPVNSFFWIASNAVFVDVEVGAGWRFTPDLLLKASYRRDRWEQNTSGQGPLFFDGHAVMMQISYGFDVNSWFDRPL